MAGKLVHFEIKAADLDRGIEFWSGVFGWQFGESVMPGMEYRMTRTSPDQGGAIFPSDEAGSGLTIYFDTDDIDETVGKIRDLGGSAEDKQPIPGVGWFASASDPAGNAFSVFQSDESVPPPA